MKPSDNCPTRIRINCLCRPVCKVCGFGEHSAIHFPPDGWVESSDSPIRYHAYEPAKRVSATGATR